MRPTEGRWAWWYVWLWAGVVIGLAVGFFFFSFRVWSLAAAVGFGVPEAFGVFRKGDSLPPLTYVVRRYCPRWLALTLIDGLVFGAGAYWLGIPHPERLLVLGGLLGWLNNHFDVAYEERL